MTGPKIPRHLVHEDGKTEALLLTAWFHNDLGEDATHRLAADLVGRYEPTVYSQIDVVAGLLDEWQHCLEDPEQYANDQEIKRPNGMTWVEFSEATRDVLAADAAINAERLARPILAAVSP